MLLTLVNDQPTATHEEVQNANEDLGSRFARRGCLLLPNIQYTLVLPWRIGIALRVITP